jgi:tetratricopeptide (TPR) repeat protein
LLLDRASALLERDRPAQSLALLKKIYPSSLPLSARAEYFDCLASTNSHQGFHKSALQALQSAIKLFQKIKDRPGLRSAFLKRGDLLRQMEKPALARQAYLKASSYSDSASRLDASLGLALCDRSLGRFIQSRKRIENLNRAYSKFKDRLGVAYTYWALATTDRFLGRFQKAETEARKSLKLYRSLDDDGGVAYAWAALGGVLRMKGWARESEQAYQSARRIFNRLGDQFGLAYASCGIGNSFRMRHKPLVALLWSKRAEKLYRTLKMDGPLAYVLWSQSQSYLALAQKNLAHSKLSESESLFKKVQDHRGQIYGLLGRGEYFRIFNPSKAGSFYKRAKLNSRRRGLQFESAVAALRLSANKFNVNRLKKTGVDLSRFSTYLFLP